MHRVQQSWRDVCPSLIMRAMLKAERGRLKWRGKGFFIMGSLPFAILLSILRNIELTALLIDHTASRGYQLRYVFSNQSLLLDRNSNESNRLPIFGNFTDQPEKTNAVAESYACYEALNGTCRPARCTSSSASPTTGFRGSVCDESNTTQPI